MSRQLILPIRMRGGSILPSLVVAGIALLSVLLVIPSLPTASADITRPAARHYHDMVYDSESDRIVLFGGYARGSTSETWVYDYISNAWVRKLPSVAPSPRDAFAMAYDAESDRVILFGGVFGFVELDDTWAYHLNTDTWTEMNPATSPPGRWGARMVYDAGFDRMIMFGGHNGLCYGDTWAYDYNNNTWTEMAPANAPTPRAWQGMEYDIESRRVVLFGGDPCSGDIPGDDHSDTWSYDFGGDKWTGMNPASNPSKRGWSGTAYDSESDRVVLFGGSEGPNETWEYDLNNDTWTQHVGTPTPSGRNAHAMAYDEGSDRVILFGGSWPPGNVGVIPPNDETWAYDYNTNAWSLRATAVESILRPSSRSDYGMAYDAESDRIVLFGGWGGTELGDTWAYDVDTNEWADLEPATSPSPRFLYPMAYDVESDRVILFGGVEDQTLTPLDETWAYNLNTNTWTNMDPVTRPPGRWGMMAYDAESDRTILFGGASGHTGQNMLFNDTWAYDFNSNNWTELSPRPTPGTALHAMTYDAGEDRVIVFGGERAPLQAVQGTWAYNFNTDSWEDRAPSGSPQPGIHYAMAYNVELNRTMLWGGLFDPSDIKFGNETWTYDYANNSWTSRSTTIRPSPRVLQRMVYDADSDRTVTFGGRWPPLTLVPDFNNETWAYDLNANAWMPLIVPSSEPLNLQASEDEVRVELSWTVPSFEGSHPITGYQIYRRTTAGPSPIALVGTVPSYADTNVTVGTTYYYHVRALNAAGESGPSDEMAATPFDATDPSVAISSPTNGETLTTVTVEVTGIASDNVAVESVELSLDESTWIPASGTTTWSGTLTLPEGLSTITARATDTSGNLDSISISVTVVLTSPNGDGPGGVVEVPPWLIGVILAVVAGAAVVTVFLFLRRRR